MTGAQASPIRRLERSAHAVDRWLERGLVSEGLTLADAHVLWIVAEHGQVPLAHLRETLDRHGSTMTGVLDRLETRGLLRRVTRPADRRAWDVAVSEEGRRVAGMFRARVDELERRLVDRLGADGLAATLDGLDAIAETVADDD
jgi:DNA-binding MarR family transcriptional regulator